MHHSKKIFRCCFVISPFCQSFSFPLSLNTKMATFLISVTIDQYEFWKILHKVNNTVDSLSSLNY